MQAFIKPFQQLGAYGQIAEKLKKNKGVLWISGCVDSQKVHAACALWQGYRQRLIITYSEQNKSKGNLRRLPVFRPAGRPLSGEGFPLFPCRHAG